MVTDTSTHAEPPPSAVEPEPVAPTPARNPRVPRVTVNLLPTEITDARRNRRVRRAALSALVVFTALLGAWYATARHSTSEAQHDLSRAE